MPNLPARAIHHPGWGWTVAGALCGWILVTVLLAPARWLALAVEQASQGRILLQEARGTLWNGSARLSLSGGAGSADSATLPSRMNWTLSPRWRQLDASFYSDCCTRQPLHLSLKPGWGRLEMALQEGMLSLPASLLSGLGTPWNTLQPAGLLELTSQGLVIEWHQGGIQIAGQAQLKAHDLSSRLSPLNPLGSYRLTLRGGAVPSVELDTLEGSLKLEGRGQWSGSRLQFNGTASARPERAEALSNLLNIIGRRKGDLSIISMV
jgi:general secretion pathway protein N